MNRTSWEWKLKNYGNSFGVGREVHVIFRTTRGVAYGLIKEIDEDFVVLKMEEGSGISAIVELDEIAGFRTE